MPTKNLALLYLFLSQSGAWYLLHKRWEVGQNRGRGETETETIVYVFWFHFNHGSSQ